MIRATKNISIAGSVAAIFLFAGFVFAQGRPTNTASGIPPQAQAHRGAPESVQQSVEAHREQGQARAAQQREKAQQRVAQIQDKVKQKIAARLVVQFDHINKVWTDHFAQILDRYDAILQKIQDRANISASNGSDGKDISATTAKIQSAKTAIAAARSAVEAQAAKSYTLDALTATAPEASPSATTTAAGQQQIMQSLRASFQTLRDKLFHDLFALRDGSMTGARKALQSALQTLEQIPGVDQQNQTPAQPEGASTKQ